MIKKIILLFITREDAVLRIGAKLCDYYVHENLIDGSVVNDTRPGSA